MVLSPSKLRPLIGTTITRVALIFLIFILDLVGDQSQAKLNSNVNDFLFKDKSFGIRSTWTRYSRSQVVRNLHLFEQYSKEQGRARIEYEITKNGGFNHSTVFFYDSQTDKTITWSNDLKSCNSFSTKNIMDSLYVADSQFDRLIKNVLKKEERPKHVIGPASLLFLIANNKEKMIELEKHEEFPHLSIRAYELIYQYENIAQHTAIARITVYYLGKFSDVRIPIRIAINLMISRETMVVHFYEPKILNLDQDEPPRISNDDQSIFVDKFAYPLGCSKSFEKKLLFEGCNGKEIKFSFTAHTKIIDSPLSPRDDNEEENTYKHFVAFDGPSKLMRVDTLQTIGNTLSLLDYQANRKYTIFHKGNDDRTTGIISDNNNQRASECFVTLAMSPGNRLLTKGILNLPELLFGTTSFVYMGRARVRGIDVKVYEGESNQFPQWFSEPVPYRDNNGHYEEFQREIFPKTKRKFIIVVYLNENEELIEINIIEDDDDSSSKKKRTIRVNIYNFAWNLSESPDENRGYEMFTQIKCTNFRNPNDKHIELDLMLEEKNKVKEEDKNNSSSLGPNNLQASSWLNDWSLRQEALIRGISNFLGIQPIAIYSLESKILQKSGKISMKVIIGEHLQKLHNIFFVGQANIESSSSSSTKPLGINGKSLIDCLSVVASKKNNNNNNNDFPVYIYYAKSPESKIRCYIDPNLMNNEENTNLNQSTIFHLTPLTSSGVIFKITSEIDQQNAFANTWFRNEKIWRPERELIILENKSKIERYSTFVADFGDDENDDKSRIEMRIRQIKMKNLNEKLEQKTINGFGFDEFDSGQIFRSWRPAANSKDESLTKIISQDDCRIICQSNFNCISYSYCQYSLPDANAAQCLLSNLDLTNLESLENSIQTQLHSSNQKELNLNLTNADGNVEQIKLIRNFRCSIKGKIFLDLFKHKTFFRQNLKDNEIIRVNSREECAKLCFKKSQSAIILRKDYDLEQVEEEKLEKDKKQQFCRSFKYLGPFLSETEQSLIELNLPFMKTNGSDDNNVSFNGLGGFCAFDQTTNNNSAETNFKNPNELFHMDSYDFKFNLLYEKQPNVQLRESEISSDLKEAYKAMIFGDRISKETKTMLLKSLKDGINFQSVHRVTDMDSCAMMCYTHKSVATDLWPAACQSFDIEVIQENSTTTTTTTGANNHLNEYNCYLNTVSLRDRPKMKFGFAKATNEIINPITKLVQRWHFEPKFESNFTNTDNSEKNQVETNKGSASVTLVLIFSFITGLLISLAFVKFKNSGRHTNKHTHHQVVVERQAAIEIPTCLPSADGEFSYQSRGQAVSLGSIDSGPLWLADSVIETSTTFPKESKNY